MDATPATSWGQFKVLLKKQLMIKSRNKSQAYQEVCSTHDKESLLDTNLVYPPIDHGRDHFLL